jgi:N-acetylglucosamine-6-phosphate deacetylase
MGNLLVKGNVILPERIVEDVVIRFENERIAHIEEFAPKHLEEGIIDCTGDFLSPGFVDIHVHGGAGADYMDGTDEAVRIANIAHAKHGTTSYSSAA